MKNTNLPAQTPGRTMSVEDVRAFFISDPYKVKLESPFRFKRITHKGQRYYYTVTEKKGKPVIDFFVSVSTFVGSVMPKERTKYLDTWRLKLGEETADEYSRVAAAYGTFLHIIIAEALRDGFFDPEMIPDRLRFYMEEEAIPMTFFRWWLDDLESDMLALNQWIADREVEPVAIEFPITAEVKGTDKRKRGVNLGGTIDLIAWLNFDRKRVLSKIDFKSGRKGFWASNESQLHLYKDMWNLNYEKLGLKVEHVFNWRPKDWRNTPSYEFKNQSGSVEGENIRHYVDIFRNYHEDGGNIVPTKTVKRITKPLDMKTAPEGRFIVQDFEFIAKQDYLKNKKL